MISKRVANHVFSILTHAVVRKCLRISPSGDLIRLGTEYGGWWIPADGISSQSIVYSAGVGEDVSFDLALIDRFHCEVWAMDPTPRSIEFAEDIQERRFHFLPLGLWSEDADVLFYAPADPNHVSHSVLNLQRTRESFTARCLSLQGFMEQLGHNHVDVLKMDIEGAEGPVLDSMIHSGLYPNVLCIEFDDIEPPWRLWRRLRRLERSGYVIRKTERRNYTLTLERAGLKGETLLNWRLFHKA